MLHGIPCLERPRKVQGLLNAMSSEQIISQLRGAAPRPLGKLPENAQMQFQEKAVGQGIPSCQSPDLSALVVRVAPSLPGWHGVNPEDLLGGPSPCLLDLLLASSPDVDQAISAFFHAGSAAVHSLLVWALRSPHSSARFEALREPIARLDVAHLPASCTAPVECRERAIGKESADGCIDSSRHKRPRDGSICVIDELIQQTCAGRWSGLESSRLAAFVSSLRETSMHMLHMRRDLHGVPRRLLAAAGRVRAVAGRGAANAGEKLAEGIAAAGMCAHEHFVESILEHLAEEHKPATQHHRAQHCLSVVADLSLPEVQNTLELLEAQQGAHTEIDSEDCNYFCSAGYCRASVRLFSRAGRLMLGGDASRAQCGLHGVPRRQITAALQCLLETCCLARHISLRRCGGDGEGSATGAQLTVTDSEAFVDACAALALLTCRTCADSAMRTIARTLAVDTGLFCDVDQGVPGREIDSAKMDRVDLACEVDGAAQRTKMTLDFAAELSQRKAISALIIAQFSVDREMVGDRCRRVMLRALLRLLCSGSWQPTTGLSDHVNGSDDDSEHEFVEAMHVLWDLFRPPPVRTEAKETCAVEQATVWGLLIEGLFVCIPRIFAFFPCCFARASFESSFKPEGLVPFALDYIMSFVSQEQSSCGKTAHGLGAALSAVNCFIAAHMLRGSLTAGHAGRRLFLRACRVYGQLALCVCTDRVRTNEDGCGDTVANIVKHCVEAPYAAEGWRHIEVCRGIGGMGMVLTAVLKGSDGGPKPVDDPPLSWLVPALGHTVVAAECIKAIASGAHGALPRDLLLEAQADMEREHGARMLRFLAALCRSSVLAGEPSEAAMLFGIFRRGAIKGTGIFTSRYKRESSSEEHLRADRMMIWQALFTSARHLSQRYACLKDACHTTITAAIVGCIQSTAALAPLLEARPVGVLLDCARSYETEKARRNRKNSLLALAELVDSERALADEHSLWELLQDDVLSTDAQGRDSLGVLLDLLEVCKAGPCDDAENVWSGFIFVMSLLCRCRRLRSLLSSTEQCATTSKQRILDVQTSLSEFLSTWARYLQGKVCDEAEALQFHVHLESCWQILLPVLTEVLQIDGVAAGFLSKSRSASQCDGSLSGFQALWGMMVAQPHTWLLLGENGCPLMLLLACLLQSRDSIQDIVAQVGFDAVKGFINRIMVEGASGARIGARHSGGGALGRERRDMLCMYIERLDQSRLLLSA